MIDIINTIKKSFNNQVSFKEKRPGTFQLYLPIYHEDGDMMDVFLTSSGNGDYQLSDFGLTIQRLSYSYDIDTSNKEAIFQRVLSENGLSENEGNIVFQTNLNTIFTDIMHVTQAYAKIGSLRYFAKETVENLFFEILDEFIQLELQDFHPVKNVYPIPGREEVEADYSFTPNGHNVYLFGVKDYNKARLATIACLEMQRANINARGWVVNEDFEKLPSKDRARLTNVCDKQFTSLDQFKSYAKVFLERERA